MIRQFVTFAVDRPVINHILMVFMLVLSIFAYQDIPKEIFPPSELDQITITGGYPGASADVLDKMAVRNIEDEIKSISEIDNIDTVIQNGFFSIRADIKEGSDNQLVLGDVKDVIANIRRDLPADMDEPIAKITVHDFPLLLVAISGNVPKKRLLDIAEDLKSKLSAYKDLSGITIRGDADDEVLIELDNEKLTAYGLPKESVYKAISTLSSIFPIGTIEQKGSHLYLSTINGEKSAKALESTLITVAGKRVRLGDIAHVQFGLSESNEISHFNGVQNISININKTKKGNAIALSREIKQMLKEVQKEYKDVVFEAYTDTSIWIKNRLNLVSSNILFGLILVFLALLLSVNYKIALVVAIGIPTSFMITLIAADMIGYSLNMLTLLGALIALGMLVDEAIVVAENIYRHMEMGKAPREAAIDGSLEMFPAVLTATLTTVFAFLPLLIMSGEMGMFMKVLPVMISILLLSSLFEAFYFLPLHSKEFFSTKDMKKGHDRSDFWLKLDVMYERLLGKLLKRKKRSLFLLVTFIILSTVGMLGLTKFKLFPEFDSTQIYLNGKIDVNSKLEDTEKVVTEIEKKLLAYYGKEGTEVSSITSVIGLYFNADQTFQTGKNLFHIFINLHEKAPENFFDKYINPILSLEYDGSDMIREKKAQEIATETQKDVVEAFRKKKLPNGEKLFSELNIFVPQTGIVGHDIEIGLNTTDEKKQLEAIERLKKALGSIKGVFDITDNATEGVRELKLRINEYGQMLGFNEAYVTSVLKGSFLKGEYGKMFDTKGLIRVRIEDPEKDETMDIRSVKLTTPDGRQVVRLDDIADFIYKKSFVKIFKEDGERVRTVIARVESKTILATEVMARIKPLLKTFEKEGIKVIIKGEEKENTQMKKEMSQAAMIAIFLIFISLVWMFNSLVLPLIIVSTIPLSIVGALVGTYIMGINLTMPGVMGMIGLAGVVVNDGLIMLSFIKGSKDQHEMMQKAGYRLRPILLTSITTVLGLSSMIFFASGQALIIQPMAISLGFGIAWATVLNLYYVPLMYAVIYKVKKVLLTIH
ncbi:efflux RND transporter permease subunit [Sulfurovum sp. NBC37-1]|uniref:efflux RND transporter permease subunit n=1 Tax=Sulfurovum sp. (strain NBC37-1) TaxID=387093 RepID=UPI0001587717|nr:efflux RND transporter permease subunit [Sulfurovum sp. NBC37-1]BAF71592.1 cation/multidrug efflux transporter, RND superfamily [Sulfurovum sp. NBC37-1]